MIGTIFDCDGTLVDSMGAWHEVDRTLAAEAGITLTEADAEAITTMSLPEASAYLHEQCGLGESNEAVAFVQALHERGVPMAVASSTPADMLATCVERCGFAPYMKTVVSVDDLQTSKREPAVYDHARSFLGTDRAHTWAFEDAAYALDTLRAAGYRTGAIYDNDISGTRDQLFERADFLIASWEDLDPDIFLAKAGA